jgi:raffinose/stachyose/melibiose transport system permease protein
MATEVSTTTTTPVVAAPRIRTRRIRPVPEGGRVNWGLTIVVAIVSLIVILPLYFAIAMALKSPAQTGTGTGFNFPWPIQWGNFRAAWDLTNTPLAASMSLLITVIAVAGEIIVSALAAWAIVRNWGHWQFRVTFGYLMIALFIPFPVVALPQVKLMAAVGLDNPFGVAILHILFNLAFNVLLFSAFIRSIPVELEESARLDGCTTWQTFRRVVLPLLAPISATVGIFAFLQSWNDFMMPQLITANPKFQTLPVVQYLFQDQFTTNINVAFASYLMALLPTLVAFLIAQRWVVSGIMRGSIK